MTSDVQVRQHRSTPTSVPADPHHERRWLVLAVALVAQVMILLDATIVNVALPSAQTDLGFADATRQWVITAYVLAFGSLLPLGGRLSDLLGRKRMFLAGLVGFAVASAAAGAAPNVEVLLGARAVQGAAAALLAPAALSLIAVTFADPKELNTAFAVFGAVAGSSGAVGLLLGGVLTQSLGWRWCMYVNLPLAALAIAGGLWLLTNSRSPDRKRLSVPGTVVGSAALFGIVFGTARAQTDGWASPVTLGSLAGGLALLALFVLMQRFDAYPLVPLHVLLDRDRGAAYLAIALGFLAVFATFLFLTFYFQMVLGYSPIKTGVAILPMPVAIAVAATLTQARLVRLVSLRAIIAGGLTLSAVGATLLTNAGVHTGYATYALPGLLLIGVGIGSAINVFIALGQQGVPPEDAGTAGAMNNVSQQVGSAIGVALLSTFVASATRGYRAHHLAGPTLARQAAVHGYDVGFAWAAGVFLAAALICGALVRPREDAAQTEAGQPVGLTSD